MSVSGRDDDRRAVSTAAVATGRSRLRPSTRRARLVNVTRYRPAGAARRYAPPDGMQFDPKIAADLCPSADGSAVHTSLVAGGG